MPLPAYTAECDRCGVKLRDPMDDIITCCTQDQADEQARRWGWTVERHWPFTRHLCPACARLEQATRERTTNEPDADDPAVAQPCGMART